MRKPCYVILMLTATLLMNCGWAQSTGAGTSATANKPAAPASTTAAKPAAATAALPTEETVNTFLAHTFAYDPKITWKILSITQLKGAPGVADVDFIVNGQQDTHILVLPGGKFAVERSAVIPFGVDPYAETREELKKNINGPARGSKTPEVLVVVFSDLECPHCKIAEPVLDRVVEEMPNVRLVFQPMPLPMHKWAFKAAQYAQCVREQDPEAFWTFIHGVFTFQADIKDEAPAEPQLKEIAKNSGADPDKAATCAEGAASQIAVQKSFDLGRSLGVSGTPTVFVNGRPVQAVGSNEMGFDRLKAVIQMEAAVAKPKSN